MKKISVSIMRGGTSRGVFVRADDLAPYPDRDEVVRRLLGSPNQFQIDGLGGSQPVSSKFVVVGKSTRDDADLDYQVAQVGIGNNEVDWSGTCGNLTSAVGPFALDEGLVSDIESDKKRLSLTLHNKSTGDLIRVSFETLDGRFNPEGDTEIGGVEGTGSRIDTHYLSPVGGTLGKLFPSDSKKEKLTFRNLEAEATFVDISHPYLFVAGEQLGLASDATFQQLRGDVGLQKEIEELRVSYSKGLGVPDHQRTSIPRVVLCFLDPTANLRIVAFSGGVFVSALPVTAGLAIAGASKLKGTLVHDMANSEGNDVTISHPTGTVTLSVDVSEAGEVKSVGLLRTARHLLRGSAFL